MIRIAIIGMGLIGTSLGMALRDADPKQSPLGPISVVGYDKHSRAVSDARGRLAIDREARTIEEAIRDAQIVVVAVPVQAMREVFRTIGPLLSPGTIVTDVASTKLQVLEWARELLPETVDFIGGHPMAGKEQSGASAADPELFKGAIYCLAPATEAKPESLAMITAMVQQSGAKSYYIDPTEHDAYVAGISHIPFILSTALVEITSRSPGWKEMAPLAATGFRDISRLASGDPEMHRDICMTNRESLTRWLDDAARFLLELRDLLEADDSEKVGALFTHAHDVREQWLDLRPNMRPGEDSFQNLGNVPLERPSLFGRRGSAARKRRG